ncbi:MAG: hypothetical protein JXR40_14385, partial [Pontiellaceae bacterium]|nr:hypothetical protein [Pontiellaceae bacterium]
YRCCLPTLTGFPRFRHPEACLQHAAGNRFDHFPGEKESGKIAGLGLQGKSAPKDSCLSLLQAYGFAEAVCLLSVLVHMRGVHGR